MKYSISTPAKDQNDSEEKDYGILEPEWTLEEIILTEAIRDTLDDIVAFCTNKEKITSDWQLSRFLKGKGGSIGTNFYGQPGTGKSIAAEGLAKAIGQNLIKADYSEITDSLLGGTEKKLTQLFEKAEKNNALIFFDEADGLIGQRSSGTKSAENTNQIKSHLLTLLDRSKTVVVFATNLFENYDKAFFRRILFHVGFEMPSFEQRVDLWKFHLSENVPKEISYEELSELSEGLAGGDIKNLTLKLCIKLSSKKINSIQHETVKAEIDKYKKAIEASQGGRIVDKLPELKTENLSNNQ